MSKHELQVAMCEAFGKALFDLDDKEANEAADELTAMAERLFPREHKQMQMVAMNWALGHKG